MQVESLHQLLTIMDEQARVMDDLSVLGRKKSQALVAGKMDQLDVLLRGEQALVFQMGRLEERRLNLQLEMAAQLGIHSSQLTLDRIVQGVPDDDAVRCREVAEHYGRTAGELAETNQLNTELIQQAMAYVDFSLQLLGARGASTAQVYSPHGRTGSDSNRRRLDNRF